MIKTTTTSLLLIALTFLTACGKAERPDTQLSAAAGNVLTYIATIDENPNQGAFTQSCAKKIATVKGTKVTSVLTTIGVVVFKATKATSLNVAKVNCVLSVEEEIEVHGNPSTRIGN